MEVQDPERLKRAFEDSILPRLRALRRGWGYPIYIVGGVVRSATGATSAWEKDIDLTSQGEIARFALQAAGLLKGHPFPLDANTWRIVFSEGKDRWQLDISLLRGEGIGADLSRRDFTINAMAWEITEEALLLHDPLGGEADLAAGLIRWCSPRCFQDDPLRLLRAVRFRAQLDGSIEGQTFAGMKESSQLLGRVSRERVRDEFFKILSLPESRRHIEALKEMGLLDTVIPGMGAIYQFPQQLPHRWPLWEHSLQTLDNVERLAHRLGEILPQQSSYLEGHLKTLLEGEIDVLLLLKFVALLHDIGKPFTRAVDEAGRVRFFGHEEEGRARVSSICRSLRLGRRLKGRAEALVGSHLRPILLASEERWTRRAKYRFFRDLGDLGIDLLLLGWADLGATVGEADPQLLRYQTFVQEMVSYDREEFLKLKRAPLVRGRDVIASFGIPPGPLVGLLLKRIQEAEAEGGFATREEGLRYLDAHRREWLEAEGEEEKTD